MEGFFAFAPALAHQSDGFAPEYFPRLVELESGHFWFEARNRVILWALQKYLPQAVSFLEIGCGTAFVLSSIRAKFPGMRICGSEVFIEGLPFAAARLPGVDLFQMDARSIPFDSEFDGIGAFDVIEHIEEDRLVLHEIWRALKPGGAVLITVPQHPLLWSAIDEHSFHKRRYTAKELAGKLREAGFQVLYLTSFVSLLLPFVLLSRLRRRRYTERIAPGAALEINPVLNRLFSFVLGFERLLIERGFVLPAGGSLFAAARRPGIEASR
jgi:SAM-dependent methyltransferase